MRSMRNLKSWMVGVLMVLFYVSNVNIVQADEVESMEVRQVFEDFEIKVIQSEGIGDRFRIAEILPETDKGVVCSFTIKSGANPENWLLKTTYPKDKIPMRMSGGPLAGGIVTGTGSYFTKAGDISLLESGSVLRFEGKVLFKGFTFEGEEQDLLTFILLKQSGLVYVTGKGKVTLKDGTQITLPVSKIVSGEEVIEPKVAVLQFHNRTGDVSLDYLGVGIAETVAGILARVESVQVIPLREAWKILKDQGVLPIGGRGMWASILSGGQGIQVGKGIVENGWSYSMGLPDKWLADFCKTSGVQIVVAGGYTHEVYGRATDEREWWRKLPIWIWNMKPTKEGNIICDFTSPLANNVGEFFDLLPLMAEAVLTKGNIPLTPKDKEALARKPTSSMSAFEQFSRGVELLAKQELGDTDQTLVTKAVGLLRQATESDPSFGFVQYQLGMLLHSQRDYEGARVALERFLTLEPTGRMANQARWLIILSPRWK